ncbi:MAG: hypothetical protein ACLQPN_10830 [Bryobacteraceae bacterium]
MSDNLTQNLLAVFVMCLAFAGRVEAQRPVSGIIPPGAKLYIAPMEWQLDRFVAAEIRRQGLPLQVVALPQEAGFVMTGLYQSLGSHMISPGHYIQVKIVAADDGKQVWRAEASDFAVLFGRLRPHGLGRAAQAIVKKLRNNMSGACR